MASYVLEGGVAVSVSVGANTGVRKHREARVESGQRTRVQRSAPLSFSVSGRWIPRLQLGCNIREGYQAPLTPYR